MSLFNNLIKTFKDKAPGQNKSVGQVSSVQGQGTDPTGQETGQDGGIADTVNQFSLGSQRPGDTSENEESRTNRRTNRGVVDNMRQNRTLSRFGVRKAL